MEGIFTFCRVFRIMCRDIRFQGLIRRTPCVSFLNAECIFKSWSDPAVFQTFDLPNTDQALYQLSYCSLRHRNDQLHKHQEYKNIFKSPDYIIPVFITALYGCFRIHILTIIARLYVCFWYCYLDIDRHICIRSYLLKSTNITIYLHLYIQYAGM